MAHAILLLGILFTKHEFVEWSSCNLRAGDGRTTEGSTRLGKALLKFEELDCKWRGGAWSDSFYFHSLVLNFFVLI